MNLQKLTFTATSMGFRCVRRGPPEWVTVRSLRRADKTWRKTCFSTGDRWSWNKTHDAHTHTHIQNLSIHARTHTHRHDRSIVRDKSRGLGSLQMFYLLNFFECFRREKKELEISSALSNARVETEKTQPDLIEYEQTPKLSIHWQQNTRIANIFRCTLLHKDKHGTADEVVMYHNGRTGCIWRERAGTLLELVLYRNTFANSILHTGNGSVSWPNYSNCFPCWIARRLGTAWRHMWLPGYEAAPLSQ